MIHSIFFITEKINKLNLPGQTCNPLYSWHQLGLTTEQILHEVHQASHSLSHWHTSLAAKIASWLAMNLISAFLCQSDEYMSLGQGAEGFVGLG